METEIQRERAQQFREYHTGTTDGPLVLPNSWDCASTIVYERAGFSAVGTSSAGVAAALGVPDGEYVTRDDMLAVVDRIAHSVSIPVSADLEAGYGETPDAVAETIRGVVDAGAVGVNLEDGTDDATAPLVDSGRHAAKIRATREVADDADVPLVVNGRTDVFWRDVGDDADRVDRAVDRANAYYAAGADCLFVPGVTDLTHIEALADGIDGPLNVLGGPGAPPIADLGDVGVARVSVGSGPMRATLGFLRALGDELRDEGTYDHMRDAVPYDDLHEVLSASLERREG
jgi:2-methylisocitrate lyase-like PEP mutase family enzyme